MLEQKFNDKIKSNQDILKDLKKRYSLLGNLKLLFALGFMIFGYNSLASKEQFYKIIFIIVLAVFIYLIIAQLVLSKKIDYHNIIIEINEKYIKRITGDWTTFKENGEEFTDKEHNYSYDLDITGKKSLFQLINTTHTYLGKQKFVSKLLNTNNKIEDIYENQEATKELAEKLDFCQDFEFNCYKVNDDESILKIIEFLEKDTLFLKNKNIKIFLNVLPIITVPIIFAGFIFKIKSLSVAVTAFIILQLILWGLGYPKISGYLTGMSHYSIKFRSYKNLLEVIQKEDFKSVKLNRIKNVMFEDNSSITALKELSTINEKLNIRHNGILYFILNLLLLWDFECCIALEKWRVKYNPYVRNWFLAIAEIESLISFSVLNHVLDNKIYPEINNFMDIHAENVGHPLIKNETRINNSFSLENQIVIVSGSNMSGKTTFLRTIGINLVLAYNGSMVCAEKFNAPVLDILTSMRIADDLGEGISTFYAELLKIKKIVNHSKDTNKMIFLIDEIFRGTNSEDRLFGAENVIKNLNSRGVLGLITTHDLEICKLDELERIENYYFKEEYLGDKIVFDYKLKKGVSKTTNGKQLMHLVGITL